MIRRLWFAMPEKLEESIDLVPERAGVLLVNGKGFVTTAREAQVNPAAQRWTVDEAYRLARLGTMRYWVQQRNAVQRWQEQEKAERARIDVSEVSGMLYQDWERLDPKDEGYE